MNKFLTKLKLTFPRDRTKNPYFILSFLNEARIYKIIFFNLI